MTDNRNVKFTPGRFYCWENSDYEITIAGTAAGMAIVRGWKLSTEPIRIDSQGNEFIRIDGRTYYAFAKA